MADHLMTRVATDMGISVPMSHEFFASLVRQARAAIERGDDVKIDGLVVIRHFWHGDLGPGHIVAAYLADEIHEIAARTPTKPIQAPKED